MSERNNNPTNSQTVLQVLICTFGADGINRVAEREHPHAAGVEYIVSWQLPDGDSPLPQALERPDFRIVKTISRGLSRNRNNALSAATAPLCLISDDDVSYTANELETIIRSFADHPEADIITFKYRSDSAHKFYPDASFNLRHPIKGYFTSSIEIAFRRDKVNESGVRFNEDFGIGGRFMAGEENLFLHYLLRKGLNGIYIPKIIAYHPDLSTGEAQADNPDYIRTKGAVFIHLHPNTWPLRMLAHAVRHKSPEISRRHYLKQWLKGARQAHELNKQSNHESF